MKLKKLSALTVTAVLAFSVMAGCGSGGSGNTAVSGDGGAATAASTAAAETTAAAAADNTATETAASGNETVSNNASGERTAPPEGKDTNNGRPYNLELKNWDGRQEKYLNGINATILPIVEQPLTITIWLPFSSTVVTDVNDTEVFKALKQRTGISVTWMHPPQGQTEDNFNLLVSSNNLPDIFCNPPAYSGGPAKAVDDGIFVDLTPYVKGGQMPNTVFLMKNRPDLVKDYVDDAGRYLAVKGIDIVPTSPWSGLWVRQDWLEDMNLTEPKTIDDWDVMLRAMQKKVPNPLSINIKDWYGVNTNFEFAGSYETGYEYIRRDGKTVEYGPINAGYLPFLTKMNQWYTEGLIDPDFATRPYQDYVSNCINGVYGAFGMAYGDVGPMMLGGQAKEPRYQLKPVLQPTSQAGQTIHLRQGDEIVRSSTTYMAAKAVDDGVDKIVAQYLDYWYSQDGGDLFSMGPEGVSYKWNSDGQYEWIYPDLVNNPDADFWTLMDRFKSHYIQTYLRDSSAYINRPEVQECIDKWASQLDDWRMPAAITQTPEEAQELAPLEADIKTYRDEMTVRFITGQTPLTEYSAFVDQMHKLNIDRCIELKQAALDRYLKR